MRHLGVAGKLYTASVILVGAAMVPVGLMVHPLPAFGTEPFWKLLFLAAATQVAALMPIRWSTGTHSVTVAPLLALGLLVPGGGVALVAWLCLFDGRLPGRDLKMWQALFNRANGAITYGVVSLAVARIPIPGVWEVPVKSIAFSLAVVAINYPLTAAMFSFVNRMPIVTVLAHNVRLATVQAMLILGFAGGTLYVLLERRVGYLMAPALVGVLVAVRSNVAHAQRQAQARQQTLRLAAQALDARDRYTESHSERVADIAWQIGRAMGLNHREAEDLRTAGSLHDLGKIGIPDHILNKPDRLTADEWRIMKTHSDIGADMISQHSALAPVAPFVRHHHERWDGSGYPQGLIRDAIPLGARILTVADAFDTMVSPRLYRTTFMTQQVAAREIASLRGTWYDPKVVDAFQRLHDTPVAEPRTDLDATTSHRLPASIAILRRRPRFAQLAVGMSVSSLGDPLTTVATMVSIYVVTRQPLMLAGVYVLKAIATIAMAAVGGVAPDRFDRKRLILLLELMRAATLVLTPFALMASLFAIFPIIFALAAVNAIVQPARQAIVPELLDEKEVGTGTATIASATMLSSVLGFPLAGAILWLTKSTSWLFVVDGLTFAFAGALAIGLGKLGGGRAPNFIGSGWSLTWSIRDARAQLIVSTLAAFFISMSFPALLVLAYHLATATVKGAQSYTILEAVLAAGIFAGSVVVGQLANPGRMGLVLRGLFVMGVLSVGIGLSPWLIVTAVILFAASIGNAVYGIANQTALLQAGDSTNRGRIMSTRYAVAQTALVAGSLIGGITTASVGPNGTYAILGLGLIAVAAVAAVATAGPSRSAELVTRPTGTPPRVDVAVADRGVAIGSPTETASDSGWS